MKNNPQHLAGQFCALALVVMITVAPASAANFTWDASGGAPQNDGAGAWNATGGTNWFDGSSYGAWGNTGNDTATFGINNGAAGTITIGAGGVTANQIIFNAAGSGSYLLTGGNISLAGSAPGVTAAPGVTGTISSVLTGTAGYSQGGLGTVILTAANTYSGLTTLGVGAQTTTVLSGISASFGTGDLSTGNFGQIITSTGALNGSRTISNPVVSYQGGLDFGSAAQNDRIVLAGDFAVNVSQDVFTTAANGVATLSGNLTGGGTASAPGLRIFGRQGAKIILSGTNNLAAPFWLQNGGVTVFENANALGATNGFRLAGGTLEYGAGLTTDISGRINTALTTAYKFNTGGNNVTFNTALTAAAGFTKSGEGTLTLNSATASTFSAGITIWGGTLALDFSNMATPTNLVSSTNPVSFNGGTLSLKGKAGTPTAQALGALTIGSRAGTAINLDNAGGNDLLSFTGISRGVGSVGTLNVNLANGGAVNSVGLTANSTLYYATVTDPTASGIARADASQNIVRLTSANQTTMVASSNSTSTDFLTSGSLTLDAGTKGFQTLTLDATSANGTLNIGTGTLSGNAAGSAVALIGNNNYTISNGTLSGASGETILHTLGSGTLTIAAGTVVGGTQIVKNGAGTLLFQGAGAGGEMTINQGILAIAASNPFGTLYVGGDATLRSDAPNVSFDSVVVFNNVDQNVGAKRVLTVQVDSGNALSMAGALGFGGLTKTGSGVLTLSSVTDFSGGLYINAGTVAVDAASKLGHRNYTGTFINGGTLRVNGTALNNLDNNYVNWGSFNGGLDIADSANTFTVNSALGGNGSLTKSGAGTLALTAANAYTGSTTIDAGTLLVNGSLATASSVAVNSGGTLGGSGTIGGAVTVNSGGTLAPGNSPGILTVGSLVLNSGATTLLEVNDTAIRGTDFDGITISNSNSLTYGGNLTFSFGNTLANTTIDLFSFTGAPTANFANVSSTGSYVGAWSFANDAWSFTSGQQTLSFGLASGDLSVIPEPSTWALLGLGLGFMLIRQRSRKQLR